MIDEALSEIISFDMFEWRGEDDGRVKSEFRWIAERAMTAESSGG